MIFMMMRHEEHDGHVLTFLQLFHYGMGRVAEIVENHYNIIGLDHETTVG